MLAYFNITPYIKLTIEVKMSNFKDIFTNIIAVVLVIAGAVNAYLQSLTGDINWFQLVLVVTGALVAYFTGKGQDGKPV